MKFYGNIESRIEFFNTSETSIDKNIITKSANIFAPFFAPICLFKITWTRAYNVMEGFSSTEQNNDSHIEIVKNHYGKTNLMINANMNNLLNLDLV